MANSVNGTFWDLDGTLVDTGKDIVNAINFTRNNFNLKSLTYPQGMSMVGQGFEHLLNRCLAEIKPDRQILELARDLFIEHYHQHLTDFSKPYSGILEILKIQQYLQNHMAVITNKNIISSRLLLFELDIIKYFHTIKGGGLNLNLKPDPDMLINAMQELDLEPGNTVMIGDSWTDILSARNAGITSILVCWGFKDIRNYKADYTVQTPEELAKVLTKLFD